MNKIEPKTLAGFMELNPNEQIVFNKIKNVIEKTYQKYGFYPLDTPIIELSEVLLAKAGGETEKQIYRFNKGENDLSLRFDLTVPLAKYVAKRYNELVFPFKRYQIGKVYRGERPQKGRFREFYQCDIDVIGDETLSIQYDAEMPSIIYNIFTELNIGPFIISINNRKLLTGFFKELSLDEKITDILRIIDKIDKIGPSNVTECLKDLSIEEGTIQKIMTFISIDGTSKEKISKLNNLNIENEIFKKGLLELEIVINNILSMGIDDNYIKIDLTIARGLDYYTGTVYETKLVEHPEIGSICSGGRYDNLAENYTDKSLPGVGISIGLTRLFDQLLDNNIIKIEESCAEDVIIIPMCDNFDYIHDVASTLRRNNISVNTCYIEKGFKQKIRYADKSRVKYIIIIGEDEVNSNTITLKNMNDGTQINTTKEEIITKSLIK